ncbi:hypothetical protein BH23THE1_BH23THE1_26320 [soil metagenome]
MSDFQHLTYYMVYGDTLGCGPLFTTKSEADEYNRLKYNCTHIVTEYIVFEKASEAMKMGNNKRT